MSQRASAAATPQPFGRTFEALHSPIFRRLWALSWAYYTSRAMELVVLSWLVLEVTNSPSMVALVGAMRALPMALAGVLAGLMADRLPRRRVMWGAQAVNLTVTGTLLLLLVADRAEPWHAFVAIFITGATWAADFATRRAYLADVFAGRGLTNAMALDVGLLNASNLTGPVIGTLLIRFGGFEGAYLGIVLLGALALGIVFSVPPPPRRPLTVAHHPLQEITESLRLMRDNRAARAVVLVTVALNLFGWPMSQMVPVIARDVLGTTEVLYGVLAGAIGSGALVGAVFIAALSPRRRGVVYTYGTLLFFVASLAFAASPWYGTSLVALLAAGVGLVMFGVMQPTMVLEAVPPEQRGRAMGAVVIGIGASPAGMVAVGFLAEALGPQQGLALMSGVGLLVTLALWRAYPVLRDRPERGVRSKATARASLP